MEHNKSETSIAHPDEDRAEGSDKSFEGYTLKNHQRIMFKGVGLDKSILGENRKKERKAWWRALKVQRH